MEANSSGNLLYHLSLCHTLIAGCTRKQSNPVAKTTVNGVLWNKRPAVTTTTSKQQQINKTRQTHSGSAKKKGKQQINKQQNARKKMFNGQFFFSSPYSAIVFQQMSSYK